MSDIRKEFERFIKQDPFDIVSRHVFADYLDEETDEAELATFHREMTLERVNAAKVELDYFARKLATAEETDFTTKELIEVGYRYAEGGHCSGFGLGSGFAAEEVLEDFAVARRFWEAWSVYTGFYYKAGIETESDGEVNPFVCCY